MAKLKNLEVEGTTSLNNIEISDKTNILEMIYPIGAVYISTVFTNPQSIAFVASNKHSGIGANSTYNVQGASYSSEGTRSHNTALHGSTGTTSVSSLPPYLVVYMWKRIS